MSDETNPILIRRLVPKNFLSFGPDNEGIDLQPLNLFIGPNGSGKSNIISFLGFICESSSNGLSEAIGNLGGSGTVFRKHGAENYHSQIKAMVRGSVEPSLENFPNGKKSETKNSNNRLYYEYAFTIELSEDDVVRMQRILDVLEDLDDVQEVYHNAQI